MPPKLRKLHISATSTTIAKAQELVRKSLQENVPVTCPCCTQTVRLTDYSLTLEMAKAAVILHRADKGFVNVGEYLGEVNKLGANIRTRSWVRLTTWGLLESNGRKEHRLTEHGHNFAKGEVSVPKVMQMYNGKFVRFAPEKATIREILGDDVDYDQLMAGNYGAFVV